ncbi:MAG TPA: APC family permease [Steroidobacteraceae bacterium]|nr:APC family permease [Steroidobacteraceae bacterium]
MKPTTGSPTTDEAASHPLRRVLGLRDLIPMQILIVFGPSWPGTAAHQAGSQVSFWLIGALLLFLPVAAAVQYCVQIWPYEGGVYQWTKHAFGPFAGFLSAWNLGAWVLLIVSSLGVFAASGLSYALGPHAAWMAESRAVILSLDASLFGLIFLVNVPGLRIGRWVSHFGTAATLFVAGLLIVLLFAHPHATPIHPHVSPQPPFSLKFPVLTLVSLNLFSKIAFNGYTALEQVAVFAGETRNAARSILRSAWIAAPVIALIYILMTGSILTYTRADQVDLVNPIAQIIATAFGAGGSAGVVMNWGAFLSRATILALVVASIAQFAVYIAETSRLPMVAAWDHLIPAWFTRLHPRYGTPTGSLAVIVVVAVLFSFLASSNAGAGEAFQLLVTSGFVCYGINYLLMFAVPLLVGTRLSLRPDLRPPGLVRAACVCGASVTLLSMIFNLIPIVDVARPWVFALEVGSAALGINLIGAAIYWRGSRPKARLEHGAT